VTGTFFDHHDALLFDLDGTVYRGGAAVPGAKEALGTAHRRGVGVRYVTNNASKTPRAVADHLNNLGLEATPEEVSTSSQAGAAVLADDLPRGAKVLVVGSSALESEVDSAGLVPVRRFSDQPAAVVQGHSPETGWRDLAEACLAIRDGAFWVACNGDVTLPTERGELPGNGAMVAALQAATGQRPRVAGKPERPLVAQAIASAKAELPLMVGDRLDTDIAGAVIARIPALMVLTGVNTAADLLAAPAEMRPHYVGADLSALQEARSDMAIAEQRQWTVSVDRSTLELASTVVEPATALSALRALCAAWWAKNSGPVEVKARDDEAARALCDLGLA
jgi:HAD superfamily hydrolase (TIGR01450 family)